MSEIRLVDHGENRVMTLDQLHAAIGGGGGTVRTTQPVTYQTITPSPTVFYTALNLDSSVLTSRRSTGVTHVAVGDGFYRFDQAITLGLTDFIVLFDEGDVNDYVQGWVTVDT